MCEGFDKLIIPIVADEPNYDDENILYLQNPSSEQNAIEQIQNFL